MARITGTFKFLFALLVVVILSLLTYSLWYQSTWLAPNANYRLVLNSTAGYSYNTPNALSMVYSGNSKTVQPVLGHTEHLENAVYSKPKIVFNSADSITQTDTRLQSSIDPQKSSLIHTAADYRPQDSYTDHRSQDAYMDQRLEDHRRGYIVVLSIYEQQTMASGNLLQLQCWAKYLDLVVVKPFMKDSNMLTPLDEVKHRSMLRMEDTFDMQDWVQYTRGEGYAPLVEWAEFVRSAPQKLIVVQARYPTLTHVKSVRAKGLPFPHPPTDGKAFAQGCKFRILKSKGMSLLQSKGFVVVRSVCLNFLTGDELSMKQLQEHILGEFEGDKVSILIDEWRGLGENQRMLVQEEICREKKAYREHTKPSARLLRDAEAYKQKYLTHSSSNSSYVAIMARYEMTGLTKHVQKGEDPHAIIPLCLQLTHQNLEVVKKVRHIPHVFLSIDIGKYGSDSFKNKKYFGHLSDMEGFVEKVYDREMKVRDWERTFEDIAHTQDSGYIAMLQLVLVTKAECIVFVGGGTFQRHALHFYQELHPDPNDRCVRIVEKCTSPYRPVV